MSAHDILHRLAIDARRLRLGHQLPAAPAEIPWELVQRVRADFRFLLDEGATLEEISRAMGDGFSRATLSKFRDLAEPGQYIGDLDRIARGVNQFLETIARRHEAPKPAGWVETGVAKHMLLVIAKTIELQAIGLIYSDAGRGKSMTLQAAAGIHPGAVLVRVLQSSRSASGFAKLLAGTLQLRGCKTMAESERKIIAALRGTGRALLIDEAHQLSHEALEFVRDLHDACGVPIVLAGTARINEAVSDSDMFFGQMSSRVAIRYDVTEDLLATPGGGDPKPLHSVEEIRRLYESDKVRFTDEGRLLLARIANLPGLGGLRLCTKIVQVAASAAGGGLIDGKLLLQVIRTLHGRVHAVAQFEQAIEHSRLKIA